MVTNKKQADLNTALEDFKKCAELYLQVYGTDISDTIYGNDDEEDEEILEVAFDHKNAIIKAAGLLTKDNK